jgi:hypothetical protein
MGSKRQEAREEKGRRERTLRLPLESLPFGLAVLPTPARRVRLGPSKKHKKAKQGKRGEALTRVVSTL